jgi:hypothetical protein
MARTMLRAWLSTFWRTNLQHYRIQQWRETTFCVKAYGPRRFLEPQHGLLRQRTSSVTGNDRRVQPPNTHAKRYTKKSGTHTDFLASLWCLLSTSEYWTLTTYSLYITAVTRWWPTTLCLEYYCHSGWPLGYNKARRARSGAFMSVPLTILSIQ